MYRSVVSQQGRVTVEADANEGEEIRAAETRADLVDVIGPSGSPDNGFKISVPSGTTLPLDFAIAAGTMYVGGVRVESTARTRTYSGQRTTEWLDAPTAPLPFTPPAGAYSELVYLALTELEVGAVEDPALREVALGGPDTAARTRMLQRVQRTLVEANSCQSALAQTVKRWLPAQAFDRTTMRLESSLRLKVDFAKTAGAVDPCQPIAQAGFLGAENQLIRVQIAAGGTSLLWGYDNASFLYRATVNPKDTTELTLASAPVDVFHQPRIGQWIEVLASAVGQRDDAFVAAPVGVVAQVTKYDPSGTLPIVTITPALTADFLATATTTPAAPRQLFVRVWENLQPFPTDVKTPVALTTADNHDLGVVLRTSATAGVPGDYWMIGVRPSQPDEIFPTRLRSFQPPDGPSRWAAPLAVIAWHADHQGADVTDCRRHFKNLVGLTEDDSGCCELLISPGDDIAKKIAERVASNLARSITGLHVRFASGVFTIEAPIVLDAAKAGDLTVSGCGRGTQIRSTTQEVLLVLRRWNTATLRDLSLEAGVAAPGHGKKGRPDRFPPAAGDELRHLGGAITFLDCGTAVVEDVVAACAAGGGRAASCLTVRNSGRGAARVRSCDFFAGPNQLGVLLVNVDRATVDDNRIRVNPKAQRPDLVHALGALLADGLDFRAKKPDPKGDARALVDVPVGAAASLRFTTDSALSGAWAKALAPLDRRAITPPGVTPAVLDRLAAPSAPVAPAAPAKIAPADRALAERRVAAIIKQAIDPRRGGPLTAAELAPFKNAIDRAREGLPVAMDKAIVVGGAIAGDIRITNNTIDDTRTGIHVGLSIRRKTASDRSKKSRPGPIHAGRVQIIGNTISQRAPRGEHGVIAGIFVGNVDYATVRDNRIESAKGDFARRGEGIRVWGQLGPLVLVTGNACVTTDVGIRVHAVHFGAPFGARMWRVTQNVVIDGGGLAVRRSVDGGDNVVY